MSHYFDTACPLVAWYDKTVATANAVLQAADFPGLTSEEREKLRAAFLTFYAVRTEISHRIGAEKAWVDYHMALTPLIDPEDVEAARIDVAGLSAIDADLGTVTAGKLEAA